MGDESIDDILSNKSKMSGRSNFGSKRFDINTSVRKLFEDGMGINK